MMVQILVQGDMLALSWLVQLCVLVQVLSDCRGAPRAQGKTEEFTWCTGEPVHR
jgi:hypothetical protein